MEETKMKKILILVALTAIALLTITACAQTDVIAKVSITSFDTVLKLSNVTRDEIYGGWSLNAPDQSVRFFFSSNFKVSAPHDVMMETDAKPFIDAGLDPSKLPAGMFMDGKIMVGQDLSDAAFPDSAKVSALASYEELVRLKRETIGYHAQLDHYGIDLGNGNKFEWAKDLSKNDKDVVFVLDPQIFINAGVNPSKVTGWVFAKVEIKDTAGKTVPVDKFLKPFNLQ
jgi:hypothetical protein